MRKMAKVVFSMVLAAMMLLAAGCSKSGDTQSNASSFQAQTTDVAESTPAPEPTPDVTKTAGTVVYGVYNWGVEDAKKQVTEFNKVYPNINVQVVGFEGDLNPYLTTQAASSTLPDVVFGWENLNFPVSQGWVYPLDDFLAKDEESKNISATALNGFKFGGKTYALPKGLQFNGVMVNLDLVDQLNMDPPTYDWTVDQFKEYLKKATTDKYSGINHLWAFDEVMSGVMSKDLNQLAYDQNSGTFKFTAGSWVKAISLQKELKAVPGLVSDDLKNDKLREEGKEDDYQKKFGKDADALREGKVLMGLHGTWDLGWIRTMNYKFDLFPMPQDPEVGYRQVLHADYAYMTSTAKEPEAAYQFVKWMSFGKQGIISRLELEKNKVDGEGKPTPDFFIPSSNDPDVVAAFEALEIVPNGVKYMHKNMNKTFRGDYYKIVPGWDKAMWEVIFPKSEEIRQGKVEASAVAKELEDKANAALTEAKTKFDTELADVQAKFGK